MAQTATTYSVGQLVRDIGHNVNVLHGSVGMVKGYHHILTNCPVVWFPRGTFGPHDIFAITRPETDLEPVAPCLCKSTTTGTWYGQGHDAGCPVIQSSADDSCVNCGDYLSDHNRSELAICQAAHLEHLGVPQQSYYR